MGKEVFQIILIILFIITSSLSVVFFVLVGVDVYEGYNYSKLEAKYATRGYYFSCQDIEEKMIFADTDQEMNELQKDYDFCEKIEANKLENNLYILNFITYMIFSLIFILDYYYLQKTNLVLTDKRIYLTSFLGYEKSITINKITSIKKFMFGYIVIKSSSAKIKITLLKDSKKIYQEINRLLIEENN